MFKKLLIFGFLFLSFGHIASAQLSINLPEKQNTFSLEPGSVTELEITLRNAYRGPMVIAIYTVDSAATTTGSFAAKQLDDDHYFFGVWARPAVDQITLEAGETKTVNLTINIPANVTPGDYAGAIVVSKINAPQEIATDATSPTAAGLTFSTRLAKAVYVSIPGEKKSAATIGGMSYSYISGNQYKIFTNLENTGNTTLRFILDTQMTSFRGEANTLPPQEFRLFPNSKSNGEISLGCLPILEAYKINQKISYYEQNLITGEEKLLDTVERNLEITIIPWNYILLGLAILLLLIFAMVYKVINNKRLLKNCKKYTVKQGDTLMKIAGQYGIGWKKLAKINNIKPPYEIKSGSNILVPGKK